LTHHKGTFNFDTTPYYSTSNTTLNPLIISIPFTNAQSDGSYRSGIGLQNLQVDIYAKKIDFRFSLNAKTAPALKIDLYTSMADKMQKLILRYIVFSNSWLSPFAFYYFTN
jgi:hypothetical protein